MTANEVAINAEVDLAEARRLDAGAWRAESLCRKHPTRWWFAGGAHETVLAKGICAGCAVQSECLDFALRRPEILGVWAATTPNERAALRRARRAPEGRAPEGRAPEAHAPESGPARVDVARAESGLAVRAVADDAALRNTSVGNDVINADRVADARDGDARDGSVGSTLRPTRRGPQRWTRPDRFERNELFTPAEAARKLGVTPNTVTRWSRAGKISAIQTIGGHRRFRRAEIERVLDEANLVAPTRPLVNDR